MKLENDYQSEEAKPAQKSNAATTVCSLDPKEDEKLAYRVAYRARKHWMDGVALVSGKEEKHRKGDELAYEFLNPVREIVFFRDKEGRSLKDSPCTVLKELLSLGAKNPNVQLILGSTEKVPAKIEALIDKAVNSGQLADKEKLWIALGVPYTAMLRQK